MWTVSWPAVKRLAVVCACGVLLVGCAGSRPDPARSPAPGDVEGWARALPRSTYLTAWGSSTESSREAGLDAQAQVAAQVSSSLTAETTSIARAVMHDTEITDFQELVSEVRTTTRFEHAELIRLVEPTRHEVGGEHRVLAALRRSDLARVLQEDYDTAAVGFRSSAAGLDAAAGDLPGWTSAWARCRRSFASLVAAAAETRTGAGVDPFGFGADRATWERAHAARDSVLRDLDVVIDLAAHPEIDGDELGSRLRAGFAHLGVRAATAECRPGAVRLRLVPELVWTRIIGSVVSLELRGTVGPCSGDDWSEAVIAGPALRGEGRDPVADMLGGLTPEALAPELREALGHVIPF